MHLKCFIVMETVITREAQQESSSGATVHFWVALCTYEPQLGFILVNVLQGFTFGNLLAELKTLAFISVQ